MKIRVVVALMVAAVVSVCPPGRALAGQVPPDDGLRWKTVGAPGNRGTLPSEAPRLPTDTPSVGAVGYEYRLTETEITRAQWGEFVLAYRPFYSGNTPYWANQAFVGSGFVGMGGVLYANPNQPANMSWEYAARYCNWLHNGKANTAEAFAQGVYDTTTFTRNPDGSLNHNLTRTADARYWIPSLDEWVKGAYYDPNKYGLGEEGYWLYPAMQDTPLIPGAPGAGGQTNAAPFSADIPLNAGSYPGVVSPWGLLDLSGGMREWISTSRGNFSIEVRGSKLGPSLPDWEDRLDVLGGSGPATSAHGFRLASSVPAPGSTVLFWVGAVLCVRRRRNHEVPLSHRPLVRRGAFYP